MEVEERQLPQPPQSLGTDVARLEEERRRLEEEVMRGIGQQQTPRAPSPPDIDFARLEEEHRRQMEQLRRRMEGSNAQPERA